jgi:beta-1,4-mannosyltransferase
LRESSIPAGKKESKYLRVGSFPYNPGNDPYQSLFTGALEAIGVEVVRIPPSKMFPLHYALSHDIEILHLDWPDDFFRGRTRFYGLVKRVMYELGLRRLKHFPLVWTAHNLLPHDSINRQFDMNMIQKLIDCCDGITVMSNAAKNLLHAKYRIPGTTYVEIVPLGHYVEFYPNHITSQEARHFLGIPADSKVVLSLGRMHRYKGLDSLIKAFCNIAAKGDVLLLAGQPDNPDFATELSELAQKHSRPGIEVRIHPKEVPTDIIQVYFNACDLVALAYKDILNSGGLLLAMSFGKCTVAPRLGSLEEIAYPKGFFGFNPERSDGLQKALSEALSHHDLLSRGRATQEFAIRNYGWENIGQKVRNLYERIIENQ